MPDKGQLQEQLAGIVDQLLARNPKLVAQFEQVLGDGKTLATELISTELGKTEPATEPEPESSEQAPPVNKDEIYAKLAEAAAKDIDAAYEASSDELAKKIVTELWAEVRVEITKQYQENPTGWSDQEVLKAAVAAAMREALDGFFEAMDADELPLPTSE